MSRTTSIPLSRSRPEQILWYLRHCSDASCGNLEAGFGDAKNRSIVEGGGFTWGEVRAVGKKVDEGGRKRAKWAGLGGRQVLGLALWALTWGRAGSHESRLADPGKPASLQDHANWAGQGLETRWVMGLAPLLVCAAQ